MKRTRILVTAVIALAFTMTAFGGSVTAQHDHGHGYGTPEASPMAGHDHGNGADLSMGAAYLTIANKGDEADRLLGVTTDAAQAVEIHEVEMDNNVMEMSPMHDGLEIPAGEEVSLQPGGYHIMLIGITRSLIAGEDYGMTLTFEHAGEVTITVPILRTEPKDNEGTAGPIEAGDLEITGIWSRQAPKIDGGMGDMEIDMGTPMASPASTPVS